MIGSLFQRAADSVMAVTIPMMNGLARATRIRVGKTVTPRYQSAYMLVYGKVHRFGEHGWYRGIVISSRIS